MSLPLLHSPADVLATLLVTLGAATDPEAATLGDWPVYVDSEPPTPDDVLTVYDTTARTFGRSMIDGETLLHEGVQVRVRATDHTTGLIKARAIRQKLDEVVHLNNVTVDGTDYLVWSVDTTSLLKLGKETPTSKRSLFTINGTCSIRRLA